MNKRLSKKEYGRKIHKNKRFYCIWNLCMTQEECLGCSTYHSLLAQKTFLKLLKREGLSASGWRYAENPTNGVYIFYNDKKKKEITLETGDNTHYSITVYDFHSCTNIEYKSMTEALKSPLQGYFYAPGLHKNSFRNERKKRLIADFCGED